MKNFYHLCAEGLSSSEFIICENDFRAAFNIVGVCAANVDAKVVAFSLEDSHPHFLLYGSLEQCVEFKTIFELTYRKYLAISRKSSSGILEDWQIIKVDDEAYLKNVGTYIVNQPTKDGKRVLPFDYRWSSGPLYFRSELVIPIWCVKEGKQLIPKQLKSYGIKERNSILHSKRTVPENWLICDDLILPQNYVDVKLFESIYKTHNCYRAFLSSGRTRDDSIRLSIAQYRGVMLDDLEARMYCRELLLQMFNIQDVRRLDSKQRLDLAMALRNNYNVTRRQIATLVKLPISEIETFVL